MKGRNLMTSDDHFMQQALAVAEAGLEKGELPIGAVVVSEGKVIASAHTQEKTQGRFLIHADLLALDAADRLRPFPGRRREATLYVNLEPCLMCMGAAMSSFVGNICYGLSSPGDGAVQVVKHWARDSGAFPAYCVPNIRGGVLQQRTLELFEIYVGRHPTGPMTDWARSFLEHRTN
jgi:tRNA(adenine34) deaminase